MKKFLFTVAMMVMAITANAQSINLSVGTLTIEDGFGYLDVNVAADFDYVGWQMYIEAPEGLEPIDADLNERYGKDKRKNYYHSVGVTYAEGGEYPGSYLLVCYAQDANNNAIEGQEGTLCTVVFDAEKFTGNAATAEVTIEGFALSKADASQVNYDGKITTGIEFITRDMNVNADGTIYNLKGQRVEKAGKGLYIQNGKKVVK